MVNDGANELAAATDVADAPSRVAPFSKVYEDYEVADGYPDVRGWDVRDAAGRSIGYVCDLLVDVDAMRVRYLDVELDPEFGGDDPDRRVLIPLEHVNFDGGDDEVLLLGIEAADVHTLVPYARRGVPRAADVPVSVEREVAVTPPAGLADVGAPGAAIDMELPRELLNDTQPRLARDREAPLVVAAEELVASTRPITAGPVDVWKTVETERLTRTVPVERDDVQIERRAVMPGEVITGLEARGDEIRIPIMAEEVVVEKRLVAKEVLIIRTRRVTEQRTIETEVRREQVRVEDSSAGVRAGDAPDKVRGLGERGGPEAGV
jgi:uncharacterized protein (TIGR02271 family)